VLACLALAAASGCNRASSPAGGKKNTIKIGVAFQELDNPFFVTMKKAVDEAITNLDAEVYYTDARHDVTRQISDIEDLIQKKIDILLINPTDSVGVEGVVTEAKKAGIVVVAVDAQANGPIDCFVGSKNYEAGRLAAGYQRSAWPPAPPPPLTADSPPPVALARPEPPPPPTTRTWMPMRPLAGLLHVVLAV
jgi:ribose transport system substrate-binding protein